MSTRHVPAWKRLGLKLKHANDNAETGGPDSTLTVRDSKRKQDWEANGSGGRHRQLKRARLDVEASKGKLSKAEKYSETTDDIAPSHKKSVSFTTDTKYEDGDGRQMAQFITPDSPESTSKPSGEAQGNRLADDERPDSPAPKKGKKRKKVKVKESHLAISKPRKATAALHYLQQYQNDRPAWKFSKNHETWLLKHMLSVTSISSTYNYPLAYYVEQLKSKGARQRLAEQSRKTLAEQMSQVSNVNDNHGNQRNRLLKALGTEPGKLDEAESRWIEGVDRAALILWSLDEFPPEPRFEDMAKSKSILRTKKNKSRTSRVNIDLSSSSESESDSSSSDSVDRRKEIVQKPARNDEFTSNRLGIDDGLTESASESLTSDDSSDKTSASGSDSE